MSHSESVEMYLKGLAELGGGHTPVAIARLAERQSVTHVSANEMMKRLADQGLISHTPYRGVTLTEAGQRVAHNVIRRQRLWECFLVGHLGLDWSRAHDLACDLEHATAPEVAEALDSFLGNPETCPHGNPIPGPRGTLDSPQGVLLSELPLGKSARIRAVQAASADVLEYLHKRGLVPDAHVTVTEAAPLQGPLSVRIGDRVEAIGLNLATLITVEPLADATPDEG